MFGLVVCVCVWLAVLRVCAIVCVDGRPFPLFTFAIASCVCYVFCVVLCVCVCVRVVLCVCTGMCVCCVSCVCLCVCVRPPPHTDTLAQVKGELKEKTTALAQANQIRDQLREELEHSEREVDNAKKEMSVRDV